MILRILGGRKKRENSQLSGFKERLKALANCACWKRSAQNEAESLHKIGSKKEGTKARLFLVHVEHD